MSRNADFTAFIAPVQTNKPKPLKEFPACILTVICYQSLNKYTDNTHHITPAYNTHLHINAQHRIEIMHNTEPSSLQTTYAAIRRKKT
jgi:hypothetical protein